MQTTKPMKTQQSVTASKMGIRNEIKRTHVTDPELTWDNYTIAKMAMN